MTNVLPVTKIADVNTECEDVVKVLDIIFADQQDPRSMFLPRQDYTTELRVDRVPLSKAPYVRVIAGTYYARIYGEDIEWFAQLI